MLLSGDMRCHIKVPTMPRLVVHSSRAIPLLGGSSRLSVQLAWSAGSLMTMMSVSPANLAAICCTLGTLDHVTT
eukprot:1431084-Karenia_brevis.AAC.1